MEVEHWLVKLVEVADSDLTRIFRHYDVDTSRLNRDLTQVIDGFFAPAISRTPTLSLKIDQLVRVAWVSGIDPVPGPRDPIRDIAPGPT